jgi:DNA-directed RNA polymerase specialized sigma24 family protein
MAPIHFPPETLAAIVADPSLPLRQREPAGIQLADIVRQEATQCARFLRADPQLRQDLVDRSWEHVEPRVQLFRSHQGSFLAWVRTVLVRLGHDLRRERQRNELLINRLRQRARTRSDPLTHLEAMAQLNEAFGVLRQDLDRVAWAPRGAVDYFAILLVHLRVEIATCYQLLRGPCPPGEVVSQVVSWLPWRVEEEQRSFRPGYPALVQVWQRLTPRLDHAGGLAVISDALADPPPGRPLSYNTLAQWVHRSRQLAHHRMGEHCWHHHGFSGILAPATRRMD